MPRLLIIGYVLIEYLGEKPILYRGKVPVGSRKYMEVSKGDLVVADEVTAITYCRGTQWRRVQCDIDISTLFDTKDEPIDTDEPIEPNSETPRVMTQANLDEFEDSELIDFAKSKNITGITVRSSRKKLIPLILPYLPVE